MPLRFTPLLILAALLTLFAVPCPNADASAPKLQTQIEQALRDTGMPGAVWFTLEDDGRIRTGAAGTRNAASGEPMRVDDKVHVGSVTKTFIATGVLQLVTAGRVELDAPLSRYLPGLTVRNPWPDSPIRVRHLLDHTSGLDDMRMWQLFSAHASPDSALSEAFSRDPSVLAVRSRPGTRFSYSNMGYTLAAMVIESVTRERYEDWLDRELLRPLGMVDSTFHFRSQRGPHADPRLAWGHLDATTPSAGLPVYLRPAGQLTTTARDLALFARFLLGDGRVGDRTLVRTDLLRAMGRATTTEAARAGLQAGYGLGLRRRDRHGVIGLCHDGSVVGYHAMLCLFPDARHPTGGKAFAVVQNMDGDGIDTARFDELMIRWLAIPSPPKPAFRPAPANLAAWEGLYVPAPNRFASFAYADFLADRPRLTWTGTALRFAPLQGDARLLSPVGGAHFIAHDRAAATHVLLDGDGERLISDGLRTYRQVHAPTYWLTAASLALGVLGLLWFLLAVPMRALRGREPARVPGVVAAALLLLPVPVFFTQSFVQLGDHTVASVGLYLVTAALPLLMAWQAVRSLRRREGLARGRVNLVAALLVLQWCAVLIAWGMLPFALWG